MSDSYAAGAEAGPIDVVQIPATPAADRPAMTPTEAARALASYRHKKQNPETQQASEAPEPAAREPAQESADEADAAPLETEATGETQATDQAETPPLELPRSWTKDRAEHWAKLDRGTQEFLLDHDRKASAEVRRVQNEAAEKLKGLTAQEQAMVQARQQYETNLPLLQQAIQQQQMREFSDIRTQDDVERLAAEDWPRYVRWDANQKRVASVNHEAQLAQQRQSQETGKKFLESVARENELLKDKLPSQFASPEKMGEVMKRVVAELELSPEDEAAMGSGQKQLNPFDHRLRLLILDGIRFRDAEAAAKKPMPKPVPPVQRPGVSQPRGAAEAADVQSLSKRLTQTGSMKDAARLLTARRTAAR